MMSMTFDLDLSKVKLHNIQTILYLMFSHSGCGPWFSVGTHNLFDMKSDKVNIFIDICEFKPITVHTIKASSHDYQHATPPSVLCISLFFPSFSLGR